MDLSKPISYNGLTIPNSLTLTPGVAASGYLVDSIDVSSEGVAAFTEKRANQDGIDASDVFLGARSISILLAAYGTTAGDFWDKTQDLLAAFSPTLAYNADTANLGYLAFDFYQPTADIVTWPLASYPSGIPMRFYCRPLAPPAYASGRDSNGGKATRGLSKQFRINLQARDPRKYLQTASTVSMALGSSNATSTGTYVGDYPTTGTITIVSGTATGTVVYTIEGSAFTLTLDATSTTYTLDLAAREFYKSGVRAANLMSNSTWPLLGLDNTITITRGSATGPSSLSLSYRTAFA